MPDWYYDGDWNIAKGILKREYTDLTDEDLIYERGKEDEFFSRVHRRLGGDSNEVRRGVIQLLGTRS